ncbi:MAG: NAD-dependent epimerase/dehydratase family protein [Candidatus Omnitrophica bacterium]|nr:NAD-dependent epimerase/dehydratase family protein [Candidatus Omnitrophota bacterium]
MRILVTGGAGFIGSHLVDALVREGHCARVLDSFDPQVHGQARPGYLNPSAEYLEGDVRDRGRLRQALAGCEAVFHFAAAVGVGQSMYQIEKYVSANCLGTATLLDVLVNERLALKRLVVASSMSIYGEGRYRCPVCGPIAPSVREDEQLQEGQWEMRCPGCGAVSQPQATDEDKPLVPASVYAVSKRDQEELCLTIGRSYRIPTVALRFFNVYGPRQALSNPYTGACAIFSSRIKNARAPLVFEDGLQTRDLIDVRDIVRANLLVLSHPDAPYQAFNVGTGRATSIADVARMLAELYGVKVEPEIVRKFRAGDIRHCYADISRIRKLGFEPSVRLEDGLRELVAWGRQAEAVDRVEQATQELAVRGLTS